MSVESIIIPRPIDDFMLLDPDTINKDLTAMFRLLRIEIASVVSPNLLSKLFPYRTTQNDASLARGYSDFFRSNVLFRGVGIARKSIPKMSSFKHARASKSGKIYAASERECFDYADLFSCMTPIDFAQQYQGRDWRYQSSPVPVLQVFDRTKLHKPSPIKDPYKYLPMEGGCFRDALLLLVQFQNEEADREFKSWKAAVYGCSMDVYP